MYQGKILNRKFFQYLLPTVLCTMAISLNEFVDSIIVSQMLGSEIMSLVNIGMPVMIAFAVLFVLLLGMVMWSVFYRDNRNRFFCS